MQYPHRVRIIDPRNRQPPQGVAYNAKAYDVIRTGGGDLTEFMSDSDTAKYEDAGAAERMALINQYLTEPEGAEPVSIDVQALVTTVDDGTRNIAKQAYSVKVPAKEMRRASDYLLAQRKFSIDNYGYQPIIDRRLSLVNNDGIFWRGSSRGGSYRYIVTSQAIPSSVLAVDPDTLNLSIAGTGNNDSPIDKRTIRNIIPWTNTFNGNDWEMAGSYPPVVFWKQTGNLIDLPIRTAVKNGPASNIIYGWFGTNELDPKQWTFGQFLKIDRVDPFPDMVDIRCSQEFSIL